MPDEMLDQSAVAEVESQESEPQIGQTESEQTTESDQQEPAEVEVEYEGGKYRVPPELKDALLRHADYTKKTQEVAEQRKSAESEHAAIEERKQAVEETAKRHQENIKMYAQREALASAYTQLNQVDLQALNQQDPVRAQEILIQRTNIEAAVRNIDTQISQREQQATLARQQETAKQVEQAAAYLAKEIKGWSPNNETDQQITAYAASLGLKNLGPAVMANPAIGVALHKAMLFDQKLSEATTKPKPTTTEAKPIKTVSSKTSNTKDPSEMTDTEFAAWRKRQIAQRNN